VSDEMKERDPITVYIKLDAYKPPEAESVDAMRMADKCSCAGSTGQGAGGECLCGSSTGGGR